MITLSLGENHRRNQRRTWMVIAIIATMTVAENVAQVIITIDDDGEGIAPADRERVLLPFVRLESSRNNATGGFGLGLTIAGAVIDGHGGTLNLDSAPSGGLRVSVTLPKPAA